MARGGKRRGAGRKKSPNVPESKEFADEVFERIHEGPPKIVKNAVDLQLQLLFSADIQTKSHNFNRLIDRKYGKPIQRTEGSLTGNITFILDL